MGIDAGQSPDLILDLTKGGVNSEVVKSLSLTLGIPTVAGTYGSQGDLREWKSLTEAQAKYLIQVRPPGDSVPEIIRALTTDLNITNAGILYDDSFVLNHKYRSLLLNLPVRHIIKPIETSMAGLKKQLMRLETVDIHNYFILGSISSIKSVYEAATALKMYGEKYAWFAGTKDSEVEFDQSCCEKMKVAFFSAAPMPSNSLRSYKNSYGLTGQPAIDAGFYFDLAVRGVHGINQVKAGGGLEGYSVTKCSDYTESTPIARNVDLFSAMQATSNHGFAFGPLKLTSNGESMMTFNLNIVTYNIEGQKIAERKEIGHWETGTAGISYKAGMMSALTGFRATTMYRVVSVLQAPFMMQSPDGKFMGYCVDLIDELKEMMGFEYKIELVDDYGSMNENMEWSGMIKELVDKRADIALGAMSVMAERENVVDFTVPYYDLVGISILMKKSKVPTSLFKFLSVLEDSVWFCILAAYVVTSIIMWIFDRWSPYSYQNNMEKYVEDDEKRYFNLKECLWFCMTSLTPQGGGEAPKNLSGRLVAATWWLFGFIIIASYTANLAAFLTVSRLETPVESLEDLSKQYKIKYAPKNGSSAATYFERMAYIEEKFYEIWKDMSLNDSLSQLERSKLAVWDYPVSDKYTKIWQSMKEAGLPLTDEEAYTRVRASPSSSEGFAFLGDATDIRYQTLTNCDLQMVGDEFSRKPYALAVQQGSPLKDQLNDAILKLLNQRKLETLKERWWNQNPQKKICEDSGEEGGGISIHNIGGVFIVIFVGIVLAIITLAFEYWYYKIKKPQSRVSSATQKIMDKQSQGVFEKSEFATEYSKRPDATDMAPVANPW